MKHDANFEQGQAEAIAGANPSSMLLPRIAIGAFCVTDASLDAMARVAKDRRTERVTTDVEAGGIDRAIKILKGKPTPDLIIVESTDATDRMLEKLNALAEVCDPDTRIIVVGTCNDIQLYRKLIHMGVDEYLVGPVDPLPLISTLQEMFEDGKSVSRAKTISVIGAKGGVGATTLAQEIAATLSRSHHGGTLLVDLDMHFGAVGLNLDIKPVQNLERWLSGPRSIDANLLEKLVSERGDQFSVLPGSSDPLSNFELTSETLDRLTEVARESFNHVVLDLPTSWTSVVRAALRAADQVVIVAGPDLASLRNTRHLCEQIEKLRPNDEKPYLVLNGCNMPKREELKAAKFAESVGGLRYRSVPFNPAVFTGAAAEGQTLHERFPRSAPQKAIDDIVADLAGKPRPEKGIRSMLSRLLHKQPA